MTAAMNLMGLVSQLQNMECAISSIIMESALKLASLTSASIFIAIETEDARRFAGSPNLVQTYLQGTLAPVSGRDLQIDVDLNARIVNEHPPQYFPTPMSTNGASSSSQQQRSSKPFMKRPAGGGGGGGGSGNEASPSTPPKRRKSLSDSPSLLSPKIEDQKPEVNFDGSLNPITDLVAASSSRTNSLTDPSGGGGGGGAGGEVVGNLADEVALGDDDDSDIEVLESVSFLDGDKFEDSVAASSSSSSSSAMMMMNPANSSMSSSMSRQENNAVAQGFVPVDVSQNQMKIDALRSIENPLLAFQKGTAECRLLTSVFYDFGRSLRETCPFGFDLDVKSYRTKTFLRDSVTEFSRNFPNLGVGETRSPVAHCRVPVGALTLKPEAFLRMNARAGFVSASKKAAKRMSNSAM